MTDEVQKIREEVVRMHNLLPVVNGDNISVNYADRICTTLEMYIDSLQEEPISNPTPNQKMSVERWKKACEAACCDRNYRSHYGLTETRDDYFVDGVQWADEHPKEEPVSEGLEEAIEKSFIYHESRGDDFRSDKQIETAYRYGFETGANWQKTKRIERI